MNEPVVGFWGGGGKGGGLNRFDKHFSFIWIDCLIKITLGPTMFRMKMVYLPQVSNDSIKNRYLKAKNHFKFA